MKYNFNKLWKILIDRNMTKGELARRAGISRSSLARLKQGSPIALEALHRICSVLGCELDDIMEMERE